MIGLVAYRVEVHEGAGLPASAWNRAGEPYDDTPSGQQSPENGEAWKPLMMYSQEAEEPK